MNVNDLAENIVEIVFTALKDRCGFDGVFDSLDEGTLEEIEQSTAELVAMRLEEEMK